MGTYLKKKLVYFVSHSNTFGEELSAGHVSQGCMYKHQSVWTSKLCVLSKWY